MTDDAKKPAAQDTKPKAAAKPKTNKDGHEPGKVLTFEEVAKINRKGA